MNHNVKKLMSSIDFDSINLDDPSVFLLSEEQGGGTPNCLCHPVPPGTMTMLSADQTECWTSVGNYLGDACPPDPLTGSWGSHCPPWGVNACPYLWACSNTMCIYLPDACDCNYPTGPLGGPFCIMCMFSDTGVCDGIPCPP